MFNYNLNLDALTREELEDKIADLQKKQAMIYSSGRADVYNQISGVLNQYVTTYNAKYR